MGILAINVNVTGLVGQTVGPRRNTMITTDSLATITTAGYLNNQNSSGNIILPTDIFEVLYSFNESTQSGTYGVFQVSYAAATGFTLTAWTNPGDVLLPVTSGDFAVFNGTTGQIKDAGYSATDSAKEKVAMLNAVPVVANNVATFSATNGTIKDSGTALSALQLISNIKAGVSSTFGGGGASANFSVPGLTSSSIVVASNKTTANDVSIIKVFPGTDLFTVVWSADPGAATTVNYVAFVVGQ